MGTRTNRPLDRLAKALVSMEGRNKLAIMLVADCLASPLLFITALAMSPPELPPAPSIDAAPVLLVMVLTVWAWTLSGLYQAVIRYIDRHLLARAGVALTFACSALYGLFYFVPEYASLKNAVPRYGVLVLFYLLASRLSMRCLLRRYSGMEPRPKGVVAIYGAGETGVKLAMALQASPRYRPACFLDQKRQYIGRTLAGLQVVPAEHNDDLILELGITTLILAIPAASKERHRELMGLVRTTKLEVKTLASLFELDGDVGARSIRDINIGDLLGRQPVSPQTHLISKCVTGKNILVTGAGGSIGSELCRQILTLSPSRLHLLDHSEFALYQIQQELIRDFPGTCFDSHLGSVCDECLVEQILREGTINTLYHAAAYKHVPMVEANIAQGLRNNILGTRVVAAAAEKCGVATCVLVSTDKAVRPTNIMGASKRIAELIFQAAALHTRQTVYCIVRFGNVLGSSGSVVPLFCRQIESGGPVTVTHPDVMRYFMLIPEAAQLVVQAGAMAEGGEIFVLDMGHPIRIVDLARTMIQMAGLSEKTEENPDGDIAISYVGMRPGEKLYEELLIGGSVCPSQHPRIMHATEYALERTVLFQQIDKLIAACAEDNSVQMKAAVKTIVHEYAPSPQKPQEDALPKPDLSILTRATARLA
ncbi:MAG: nucleoside-diphosphate sugar epimerase/dehydratase [Burkholderiaceae bacterium]